MLEPISPSIVSSNSVRLSTAADNTFSGTVIMPSTELYTDSVPFLSVCLILELFVVTTTTFSVGFSWTAILWSGHDITFSIPETLGPAATIMFISDFPLPDHLPLNSSTVYKSLPGWTFIISNPPWSALMYRSLFGV